jgi:IclR family pca regulon transcriptional regulator
MPDALLSAANKDRRRTAPGRKDSYVQSLAKGLDVLEAFGLNEPALSIARVAELTKLDRAGARRLLLTLEHLGYVASEGRRFRLTARILSLGYRYLAGLPFWRVAQPVMEELAAELEETVSIGVLDGMEAVFVWCVPGRRLLAFDASVGSRVPAYVSSVGHILLGSLDEDALKSYLQMLILNRYTEHTVATKAELRRQIRAAGTRGWSYVSRQYENNFFGVAVPIAESDGRIVAALHVGGVFDSRADRRAKNEILPRMRVAALRISGSA